MHYISLNHSGFSVQELHPQGQGFVFNTQGGQTIQLLTDITTIQDMKNHILELHKIANTSNPQC